MSRPFKHSNKRIQPRGNSGRFKRTTTEDVGLGTCPECLGLTFMEYVGEQTAMPDPRLFGTVCMKCGTVVFRNGITRHLTDEEFDMISIRREKKLQDEIESNRKAWARMTDTKDIE